MNTLIAQVTTSSSNGGVGGAIAGGIVTLVWLVVVVAMIAGMWKLFTKAGRPGWAAIIPIYNYVVMFQVTGRSPWWVLGIFVPFLNIFVGIRLVFDLAKSFGRGIGFGFGLLFLFPIFMLILAFGDAVYVGRDGHGPAAVGSGDFAPAPLSS